MATQTVLSNPPIREAMQDKDGILARSWVSWFNAAQSVLFPEAQSGTTANRPTAQLWPGRPYFDVSLGAHGKKIFVNKDATGWVDSSGNVV